MTANHSSRRLLLRAEVAHDGQSLVGHTMEISETTAFVQTDGTAYSGDQVNVRLSFPGLVEPISLLAHVVSTRLSSGPGEPGGWTLGFVFRSDEEGQQLRALLARVDAAEREVDLAAEAQPSYRVLLVEDNEMTRDVFSYRVEKYFRGRRGAVIVDVAENSEQAWNMLTDIAYDLAIVDYFLPQVNGDWLIARLRGDASLADLPVVAVSMGGADARKATIDAGADIFLHKPVALTDLFSTLERLALTQGQR